MSTRTTRGPARRRTAAAVSGFAVLALVTGACGDSGSPEEAVGSATSAVASVAGEATSAVGDATSGDDEAGSSETRSRETASSEAAPDEDPDTKFLDGIRAVGVDVPDEQDYITRGRDACASFDAGKSFGDVNGEYNDAHAEAPVTEAPVVIGSAVRSYCSQHLPLVGEGEGN